MADVFISYRNTPERRAFVQRLAAILRVHEVSVWWDYGLEAGESYRAQITRELAEARVVAPLWCAESVQSKWVAMEAELGKDKLVPARLQKVTPPQAFEAIQAADLIGWDGAVSHPRVLAFVQRICDRLGKPARAPTDMIEVLAELRALAPLPEVAAAGPGMAAAVPGHDFNFWKAEWEAQRSGSDLAELRAIAEHAPAYFAEKAKARIAEVEAEQWRLVEAQQIAERERAVRERQAREAEEQRRQDEAAVAHLKAEGRFWIDARIIHGAPKNEHGGWFKAGNGRAEWFKDHEQGPELVVVPAGRFTMGSPGDEPERRDGEIQVPVTIAEPFAVGRCAVTRGEFAAFVQATGHKCEDGAYGWTGSEWKQDPKFSWRNPGFPQDDRHPVVCVDWNDATAYAAWLAKVSGQPYRLLSEAEWEYAARAGKETPFWWGTTITPAQANYDGNYTYDGGGSKGIWRKGTLPVDYAKEQFQPNPWGLHQVHGNVWEWCQDCWNESNAGNPGDGSARETGNTNSRVVRGGSWVNAPRGLRAAIRYWYSSRDCGCGFRVARSLVPPRTL